MTGEKRALILLEDDVSRIAAALGPYQETTKTRSNLLMDPEGHALAQTGDPRIPPETLGALVAASCAATKPVATVLQEGELLTLTHSGKSASVQLTAVSEGVVLATVFDAATTVGVVVFYLKPLVTQLALLVKEISERKQGVDLGAGFDGAASDALDDVLGG
jgi:predicted regulator of Ras-like GTPase activity (Roadblock/LC7/MglB family)